MGVPRRESASVTRRLVIFDFGAVMFRWQPLDLLQQVVPGLAPDETAARDLAAQVFQGFVPGSDWSRFDLGEVDEAELAQTIARRTGLPEQAVRTIIEAIPPHLEPQAGTVAVFRELGQRGCRTAYLSNMPRSYAAHLERLNPFIAEFDDGLFSGRVGLIKPSAAIFELADRRFGVQAGNPPLFIDDHPANVAAAQAHGWQALVFESPAQLRLELGRTGWL